MLSQCMEGLNINPGGTYADLTFGGGGHARAILDRLGREGRLIAFDQDADAEAEGRKLEREDGRFRFVRGNFRFAVNHLHYMGVREVDGILADLGVSSHQMDDYGRGFSFRGEAPIDMRMNRDQRLTADEVLNRYERERLENVFRLYGELKTARRLASAIVEARGEGKAWTTEALCRAANPYVARDREKRDMARVFQALRIEVNGEMNALREMLGQIPEVLGRRGRVVVMTYHSIEDRMVKNFLRTGNVEGRRERDFYGRDVAPLTQVNNKVITPTDAEIEENPRSRSAKLRIGERI